MRQSRCPTSRCFRAAVCSLHATSNAWYATRPCSTRLPSALLSAYNHMTDSMRVLTVCPRAIAAIAHLWPRTCAEGVRAAVLVAREQLGPGDAVGIQAAFLGENRLGNAKQNPLTERTNYSICLEVNSHWQGCACACACVCVRVCVCVCLCVCVCVCRGFRTGGHRASEPGRKGASAGGDKMR